MLIDESSEGEWRRRTDEVTDIVRWTIAMHRPSHQHQLVYVIIDCLDITIHRSGSRSVREITATDTDTLWKGGVSGKEVKNTFTHTFSLPEKIDVFVQGQFDRWHDSPWSTSFCPWSIRKSPTISSKLSTKTSGPWKTTDRSDLRFQRDQISSGMTSNVRIFDASLVHWENRELGDCEKSYSRWSSITIRGRSTNLSC